MEIPDSEVAEHSASRRCRTARCLPEEPVEGAVALPAATPKVQQPKSMTSKTEICPARQLDAGAEHILERFGMDLQQSPEPFVSDVVRLFPGARILVSINSNIATPWGFD